MVDIRSTVVSYLRNIDLPISSREFCDGFLDEDEKIFVPQESTYWDYKAEFPFSKSDDYFGGVLRLICAFYNTYGGLIIFGVHDETREPGHNKVKINIETFNNLISERLTGAIECVHRKYSVGSYADDEGDIDVILVPKRNLGVSPIRFQESIGKYQSNIIYIRKNHEVRDASSADLIFLYGARSSYGLNLDDYSQSVAIEHALPSSPSTLKEFVGRVEVMDRLWKWLVSDDEPRTFLWGKGGSGKSTIAYEFARMVAENGQLIKTSDDLSIDLVIYLSAKKLELDTVAGSVGDFVGCDFSNSTELYKSILALSEWVELDLIEKLDENELIDELSELFNTIGIFLVVDDIDTLTTQGLDPGMDALYRILARSKTGGCVLYTLRNAPSQSLMNSIEVLGLEPETEYPQFLELCCEQFGQPVPSDELIRRKIADVSERRPLVLETIIGLRRTAGSYKSAIQIFEQKAGDETRSYLFDREYNVLQRDNRARLLLAALALFNKPVMFEDLEAVLHFDKQTLARAIGEVNEMFLTTNISEKSSETIYDLGAVTRSYIKNQSQKLDLYDTLKETVSNYTKNILPKNPEIYRLRIRVERSLKHNDVEGALAVIESGRHAPKVTQHPEYQALLGIVCTKFKKPDYNKARNAFDYVSGMRHEDIEAMRAWFYLERTSGYGLEKALDICDDVINGKTYSEMEKIEFYNKKGFILSMLAHNELFNDKEKSIFHYKEALIANLEAYSQSLTHSADVSKNVEWTSRCANNFINDLHSIESSSVIFEFLEYIYKESDLFIDPFATSLISFIPMLPRSNNPTVLNRNYGLANRLLGRLKSKNKIKFYDENIRDSLRHELGIALDRINNLRKVLRSR